MGNPHMEGVGCSSSRLEVKISDFWSLFKTPSYLAMKNSFRVAREKI